MMRKVHCYACGKGYDYDDDGFCPKCGAFNLPPRTNRIGADGTVIRVDGLNEQGHVNSFLHEELHAEDRKRRKLGLDQSSAWKPAAAKPPVRKPASNEWKDVSSLLPSMRGKKKVPPLLWALLAFVVFVNLLMPLLMMAR